MHHRVWRYYLLAVASVAVVYFVMPPTTWSKLVLYNGIGLSSVVAVAVALRWHRPASTRPWWFIAGGATSFLTADIVYYALEAMRDTTPFPSPADGFYLGMYPLVIVGLLLLLREAAPQRDVAGLIDAGLVAVATFAVLGILVMDTYIADDSLSLAGRLISIAYPVMDVALITVAARLIGAVQLRHPSFALLTTGLCSLLVADTIYGILNSAGLFQTGGVADAFWIGFYALIGAAALHPSMAQKPTPRGDGIGDVTVPRMAALCAVVLAVPVIDLIWGEPFDKWLTATSSMLMFLLVLGRLIGLVRLIRANERRAVHDARHDSLTGLANRMLFSERVDHFVAQRKQGVVSVLFIDLDDFKYINDSLGHMAGDELLVAVADRLRSCVRDVDMVARLSGDEFAVLLESAVDRQDAIAVAERIRDSLATPISLGPRDVRISASVGIAIERRADVKRPESLLQAADAAMYAAKGKGKGRFAFFEADMQSAAVERLDLKTDLQGALERGQFELYYQPVVEVGRTDRIHKVEALLRWNHPERGIVAPEKFIALAEQTGVIVPIGRWVLNQACTQVMQWREQFPGTAPQRVAVNLSVRQLHDPHLLEDVTDALSASGLEPDALTLEITESMLIEETDRGSRALDQLKAMQVQIAIDDFGTGYSSLSYLTRFPVDTIKIDRSFVDEMTTSSSARALVGAIVDLAQALDVDTVAEGVECKEQLDQLSVMGATYAQGYYIARPLPVSEFEARMSATRPARRRTVEYRTEVLIGRDGIDGAIAELGSLHAELNVPITARNRWLLTWAQAHEEWSPITFAVRDGRSPQVHAAALLAHRMVEGVHEFVALGYDTSASTRLAARDARAARYLAKSIVDHMRGLAEPWSLHLQQLDPEDPVARLLAQQLPNAVLSPDQWVPKVVFGSNPVIDEHLSRNMRRQIRKAWNRMEIDGHVARTEVYRTELEIATVLPLLEQIHIDRDHSSGRTSDLDDAAARELWTHLVYAHAATGEVEITCLMIDDAIAAYVIGMIDGSSYRVFDGHFDDSYSRYSPGRIVEAFVLERAMKDARFTELDWMVGVAAEKILTTNVNEARIQLLAKATHEMPVSPARELART